jgi:hypothetical protein
MVDDYTAKEFNRMVNLCNEQKKEIELLKDAVLWCWEEANGLGGIWSDETIEKLRPVVKEVDVENFWLKKVLDE